MITPSLLKAPFQVNTTDAGPNTAIQSDGKVIGTYDGSYYAVWTDSSGSFNGYSNVIVARHFDASGNPLSPEQIIVVGGSAFSPDLAFRADTSLLIAFSFGTTDTYLGKWNTSGPSLSSVVFTPIETGATVSDNPSVTTFPDNQSFVTYTAEVTASNWTIVGVPVSAAGVAGAPITLFDGGTKADNSHIVTLDNSNFAVVYEVPYAPNPTNDHDISFQIRSETGGVIKSSTVVDGAGSSALDTEPDIAALHSGGFVVTWTTGPTATQDIHGAVYDRDGNVVRSDFVVNTTTTGAQNESHVSSMDDGGFLVTWEDDNVGVQREQRFDATGNRIGPEVLTHTGSIFESDAATLNDGRSVLSFDDVNSGDPDVFNALYDTRTNVTGRATGHDLFGDGTSDQLILRSTTANNAPGGLLTMYDLSASGGQLTQIGQVGTDWSVAGSGDFNGDTRSDILMQHDNAGLRDIYSFTMGASQVTAITKLGTVGLDWQLDGSGDFDGDGFKDILIERVFNGAKQLDIIAMKNGAVNSITLAGSLTPSTYQVDGIGDFNHDSKDDILTHFDDASGRHFVELDEANDITQTVKAVANVGTEWNATGMGDFNGDGYVDILIQSDTATARDLGILVNQAGAGWVFKDLGPIVGKNVQIDGIGDFTHDGTADISAHYDTSGTSRTEIYMEVHNSAITAIHATGAFGHEWIVS